MRRFYINSLDGDLLLKGDEAKHMMKVLRMQSGDQVELFDGSGSIAQAKILALNAKEVRFELLHIEVHPLPTKGVHLWVAPTKNIDRMEWMVEKAVELGVLSINFFFTTNSERKIIKTERLERKVLSACKQSKNIFIPPIHVFKDWGDEMQKEISAMDAFVGYCDNQEERKAFSQSFHEKANVLIGPEGDFTMDEIKVLKSWGVVPVTLGDSRLRTETAAVAAIAFTALKGI